MSEPRLRAWVGFADGTELWWLRALKPGFRHCFAIVAEGEHWLLIDPLAPLMEVRAFDRGAVPDLPGWFQHRGFLVIEAPVRRGLRRPAPWRPFTCVEAVKRVLGLDAPFALTPWQLYRRLTGARSVLSSSARIPDGEPVLHANPTAR